MCYLPRKFDPQAQPQLARAPQAPLLHSSSVSHPILGPRLPAFAHAPLHRFRRPAHIARESISPRPDSSPPTPIGGGRRELVGAPQLSTLATFTVAIQVQEPAPQVTVAACIQEIACHCHNRNADELPKNTMAPSNNTAYPTASG
ncbi:hypothetical protein QR685DRAFT_547148 [Neurospora intermedia]|uniref:Uncharacterized protein n=1 Tax=Neurospora intermedia TaxID=5142 RepID=A0ABR3D626_NEUIN